MDTIIEEVFAELKRAELKFPSFPDDPVHAAAVLCEEAGETLQASLDFYYGRGTYEDMHKEAVQTAAMAFRFLLAEPRLTQATDGAPR